MKNNKISPTDLRLGNWIYPDATFRFPMEVVSMGGDWVYCDFEGNEGDVWECDVDEMRGIEFTVEILMAIGFRRADIDTTCFYHPNYRYGLISERFDINKWNTVIGYDFVFTPRKGNFRVDPICEVKYLHNLQNLFHAFGKDLPITHNMMRG